MWQETETDNPSLNGFLRAELFILSRSSTYCLLKENHTQSRISLLTVFFSCLQCKNRRQDETNNIIDMLLNAIFPQGKKSTTSKSLGRNRNEIYALANAILVKKHHLNGEKYYRECSRPFRSIKEKKNLFLTFSGDIELTRGIQTNVSELEKALRQTENSYVFPTF